MKIGSFYGVDDGEGWYELVQVLTRNKLLLLQKAHL